MTYRVYTESDILQNLLKPDVDMIRFQEDIVLTTPMELDKSVIFDLNGYVFSISVVEGVTVTSDIVEFINGTITASVPDPISVSGYGSVLKLGEDLKLNLASCAVHVKKRGKAIVAGADSISVGDYASFFVEGFGTAKDNSTLILESGKIISKDHVAISATKGASVIINDGYVETECDGVDVRKSHSAIHVKGRRTTLEINGGDVYSEFTSAISAAEGAHVIINAGRIATEAKNYTGIHLHDDDTCLEINGGEVVSSHCDGILCSDAQTDYSIVIVIYGGIFSIMETKKVVTWVAGQPRPDVRIYGGKFHGIFDTNFIQEGFAGKLLNNGYIHVVPLEDIENEDPSDDTDINTPTIDDTPSQPAVPEYPEYVETPEYPEHFTQPDVDEPVVDDGASEGVDSNIGKTIKFIKQVPVYGSTSLKHHIYDLVGCATIIGSEYDASNLKFYKISFVLPGVGGRSLGFVLASYVEKGDA